MELPELPNFEDTPEETAAVEKLCLQLGRVSYHWNTLHGTIQFIFILLISERGPENSFNLSPGIELWHNQKSDDGQRALLKIYAQSKLKNDPDLCGAVDWVLDEVSKLSTFRNDATHSIFYYAEETGREVKVNALFTAASRAARLKAAGHSDLFKILVLDLFRLDQYATLIMAAVLAPEFRLAQNFSLSDRPKLLCAQLVERRPPANPSRPEQTGAPLNQPSSFPA